MRKLTLETIAEDIALNGKWSKAAMRYGQWKWLKPQYDALTKLLESRIGKDDNSSEWMECRMQLKKQVETLAEKH